MYYLGLLIGAIIGYCGALFTMVMMWALCSATHDERGERK
jgi:hypothetical protein